MTLFVTGRLRCNKYDADVVILSLQAYTCDYIVIDSDCQITGSIYLGESDVQNILIAMITGEI